MHVSCVTSYIRESGVGTTREGGGEELVMWTRK